MAPQGDLKEIKKCRICGGADLKPIVNLGNQVLTGVFPKSKTAQIRSAPLELVKCFGDPEVSCGLVQLKHNLPLEELYGPHYGYRSGLNASMVTHLRERARKALRWVRLLPGDLLIDIGSNDGTLLGHYIDLDIHNAKLLGVDPLADKFKSYYKPKIDRICDFFSADLVRDKYGDQQARIITSLAMFYDLPAPQDFMAQIRDLLHQNGIWVFEQSYLPMMLSQNSYDTICHEHLEYYSVHQIQWMTEQVGLKILDVEFNTINGGSFAVTVARDDSSFPALTEKLQAILAEEVRLGLHTLKPYQEFWDRICKSRDELVNLLKELKQSGKKVLGYGASTKGNVILQFCGLTENELPAILEVNPEKYGCFTPGTLIPIVADDVGRKMKPDYILPLPWHFRDFFVQKEQEYLKQGGKILFPLPKVEVV